MWKYRDTILKVIIVVLCTLLIFLEFIPIVFFESAKRNLWIDSVIKNTVGCIAVWCVLRLLGAQVFGCVQGWLYILPCLLVAVNNFPFYSYFQGNMQFLVFEWVDLILFITHCLGVGLLEEGVFRGVLFTVLAGVFSKDKKGLIKTFFCSSCVFGLAHIFNLFVGAGVGETFLQVCYTTLTGGLFAFIFIKTKNLIIPVLVHAVYNFCGLLLSSQGLGTGIVFDFGTGLCMAIVGVIVGIFVVYSLFSIRETEVSVLYNRLQIKENPKK